MKFKFYSLTASIVILSGCVTARPLPPVQVSIPSAEDSEMLKQVTISSLKDPDSARFNGQMVIVDNKSACVEVNAKNTFGGYTGYQQAMLMKIDGVGWQVISIKDVSREVCIKALHSTIHRN